MGGKRIDKTQRKRSGPSHMFAVEGLLHRMCRKDMQAQELTRTGFNLRLNLRGGEEVSQCGVAVHDRRTADLRIVCVWGEPSRSQQKSLPRSRERQR